MRTLYVVGAGFSAHAGLPLADGFARALLEVGGLSLTGASRDQAEFLRSFMHNTFGHPLRDDGGRWPYLEDVYTILDLAANTGHNLGRLYSASDLRTVRRALIVRTIRMLTQAYSRGRVAGGRRWTGLSNFFSQLQVSNAGFLSLNWDTVIESGLHSAHGHQFFDYGSGAEKVIVAGRRLRLVPSSGTLPLVLKPHGSINWLYCDACRSVLYMDPGRTSVVATQLFRSRDWAVVDETVTRRRASAAKDRSCPRCGAKALGTRFVTFSYKKALDFPMHQSTWREAERLLYGAENWVFIGYSLPAADYDFKYLLKRVELARRVPPQITVITGGGIDAVRNTRANYKRLFGGLRSSDVLRRGLSPAALTALRARGALG